MQPQVEVKCFPSEPINVLVCDNDGSFIIGGGVSGDIYIWQVSVCVRYFLLAILLCFIACLYSAMY